MGLPMSKGWSMTDSGTRLANNGADDEVRGKGGREWQEGQEGQSANAAGARSGGSKGAGGSAAGQQPMGPP